MMSRCRVCPATALRGESGPTLASGAPHAEVATGDGTEPDSKSAPIHGPRPRRHLHAMLGRGCGDPDSLPYVRLPGIMPGIYSELYSELYPDCPERGPDIRPMRRNGGHPTGWDVRRSGGAAVWWATRLLRDVRRSGGAAVWWATRLLRDGRRSDRCGEPVGTLRVGMSGGSVVRWATRLLRDVRRSDVPVGILRDGNRPNAGPQARRWQPCAARRATARDAHEQRARFRAAPAASRARRGWADGYGHTHTRKNAIHQYYCIVA